MYLEQCSSDFVVLFCIAGNPKVEQKLQTMWKELYHFMIISNLSGCSGCQEIHLTLLCITCRIVLELHTHGREKEPVPVEKTGPDVSLVRWYSRYY